MFLSRKFTRYIQKIPDANDAGTDYNKGMKNEEKPAEQTKHSGRGKASFVISIVGSLILWVSAFSLEWLPGDDELHEILILLVMFLAALSLLVGAGLGIAGLLQKNRKKAFAVSGLVVNLLLILIILLHLIIIF